jgi:manganese/iron transport system ATP-binding protein
VSGPITVDGVSFGYGRRPVLTGLSATVRGGELVALVGPNGAGKTTLIRGLLGLAGTLAGQVRVLGVPPVAARRRVGYVPQADTLDADFPVSAGQVVLMGRYRSVGWLRRPGRTDKAIARDALAAVGLADRARDRFGTLSGGQRQRVLLARALAQQPAVLLLDEPFSGVDGASQGLLLDALRGQDATVVLATHDLALAQDGCDAVWLLSGRQVGYGRPRDVLTPHALRQAYGGAALTVADVTVADR